MLVHQLLRSSGYLEVFHVMKVKPYHGMFAVLTLAGVAYLLYKGYQYSKAPFLCTLNKNYCLPACMGVSNPNSSCYACKT